MSSKIIESTLIIFALSCDERMIISLKLLKVDHLTSNGLIFHHQASIPGYTDPEDGFVDLISFLTLLIDVLPQTLTWC